MEVEMDRTHAVRRIVSGLVLLAIGLVLVFAASRLGTEQIVRSDTQAWDWQADSSWDSGSEEGPTDSWIWGSDDSSADPWIWDSGGSDSSSDWDSGGWDSGGWDSGGWDDSSSWDSGGWNDSGAWDSGGSDSGSW